MDSRFRGNDDQVWCITLYRDVAPSAQHQACLHRCTSDRIGRKWRKLSARGRLSAGCPHCSTGHSPVSAPEIFNFINQTIACFFALGTGVALLEPVANFAELELRKLYR